MTWLEFISALSGHLAWPVALLLLVLLLRKQIREIVSSLRHMKYKDFEFTFGKELDRAESLLTNFQLRESRTDSGVRYALLNPNDVIISSWRGLENAITELARRKNINLERGKSALYLSKFLLSKGIIDSQLHSLIDELRKLRNIAAHPHEEREQISVDEAMRYQQFCEQVISALNEL